MCASDVPALLRSHRGSRGGEHGTFIRSYHHGGRYKAGAAGCGASALCVRGRTALGWLADLSIRGGTTGVAAARGTRTKALFFLFLFVCTQSIGRPPLRCVVFGASNLSIEAATDLGMKSIAVASKNHVRTDAARDVLMRPYELSAADLVISSLDQVSVVNLKNLFTIEEGRQPIAREELEEKEDDEYFQSSPSITTLDY